MSTLRSAGLLRQEAFRPTANLKRDVVDHIPSQATRTKPTLSADINMDRRRALLSSLLFPAVLAPVFGSGASVAQAAENEVVPATTTTTGTDAITIVSDATGFGTATATPGDFLLVHWVGTLEDGKVFDSTRGGLKYRDGGDGALRPAFIKLGGVPIPGLVTGLEQGIQGMKIGGKRTITVPPSLGFQGQPVLAPYAVVPPGSMLRYEIELLRLSRVGPDAVMTGVSSCGGGFVMERTAGCENISPAEYL